MLHKPAHQFPLSFPKFSHRTYKLFSQHHIGHTKLLKSFLRDVNVQRQESHKTFKLDLASWRPSGPIKLEGLALATAKPLLWGHLSCDVVHGFNLPLDASLWGNNGGFKLGVRFLGFCRIYRGCLLFGGHCEIRLCSFGACPLFVRHMLQTLE